MAKSFDAYRDAFSLELGTGTRNCHQDPASKGHICLLLSWFRHRRGNNRREKSVYYA